jgi:hypothetical protein
MKKIFTFSLIVVLLVILYACSDDSNPVTSAGPRIFDPFALWDTASLSVGDQVMALAVKDTLLFAGTMDSGIYISTNHGANWLKSNTGLTDLNVYALLVKDTVILAGTIGSGVFLSYDDGSSWDPSNTQPANLNIRMLARKDSNLFAGTNASAFRSTDNGLTWNLAGLNGWVVRAFASRGSKLFAATDGHGVQRSIDNGANWIPINDGLGSIDVYALAVKDTNLFAATENGMFRTSNDSTWTEVNDGLYSALQLGDPQTLIVYGSNILIGFPNFAGVYLSLNNGASWVSANAGLPAFSAYAFTSDGSSLFVGGVGNSGYGAVWYHPLK